MMFSVDRPAESATSMVRLIESSSQGPSAAVLGMLKAMSWQDSLATLWEETPDFSNAL